MSMRSRIVNYIAALIIIILFAFILPYDARRSVTGHIWK
jgi:hypothetical protein